MRKLLLLTLFFLGYCSLFGQNNTVVMTGTIPSSLTICGPSQQFSVTIYNPTPFTITNDTLKLNMPLGILYEAGSVNGPPGTSWIAHQFQNVEVFLLPNIAPLTSITLTYRANAQCNVLAFISGGGVTKNYYQILYTANGISGQDLYNTNAYTIKQPYLTITSVTNQSYNGNIGDVFTRCITVINSGSGALNGFTFTDTHGSGIQINSTSVGTLFHVNSTLEKIVIDSNQFASIGDGDRLFETGESITICESVTILNCISAASAFKAFWGCSVNACQSASANANVVFPNYVPNLVMTPIPSMNSCITQASLQQLKIVNSGLGKAINIALDIFQSIGGGYNSGLGSYIDVNSFTIQTGFSGSPAPLTPTSTQNTSNLNCMSGQKGEAKINIPEINSGDTLYIKWNSYTCCFNKCTNTGRSYSNGWRYKGTYQNICLNNYVIYENWGRVYANIYADLTDNGSPSTMSYVQTGTFRFLFSNYGNSYPVGPGAQWKFEITLPTSSCLSYAGNLSILRSDGISHWNPTSVTTSGNILTALFNAPPPWNLSQAELLFDLSLNCSACTSPSGSNAITVKSYYIPNNTCGCEMGVSCYTLPLNINCPDPCVGMEFTYFELKRTNFGLPDNEAGGGNGIPDGSGSLDFNKVKAIRAMYGDTLKASFNGRVHTNMTYPNWQYCFARERLSNGYTLSFLDAKLKIYRSGSLIATCNNFTPAVVDSGTTRIFYYDLSNPTLGSCFTGPYLSNDSVVFEPRYKVTTNIGNTAPLTCYSSNYYYLSDIPNPDPDLSPKIDSTHKFQCATYNGSSTIIGYWYRNWAPDGFDTKSCDNVVLSQGYYLSIGPDNNNYAGGNLFPYEYRNWAHIGNLTAIVPSGYTFISARFNQRRTAGTLTTNTSSWINLTPINPGSDTLEFPVEQYFQGYGGSIPLSDDGFDGTLEITLEPSCLVTPTIYQDIEYDWNFAPIAALTDPGSDTTFISKLDDHVVYDPPNLFLQSLLPSVFALNTTTTWDISVSNTSNISDALNAWLAAPVISGVSITQVYDLDNNTIVPITGSIYQLGSVSAMAIRNFRLTGTFTSCLLDSIVVYAGWNCFDGYPSNVNTYPCTPKRIALSLTPLTPAFSVSSSGPASIDLCDTAEYTIVGTNIQLGTGYNIIFRANIPAGTAYVPGTSKISYPDTNNYSAVFDPTITGSQLEWNISNANGLIGTDGLKGLIQDSLNSFRFKFELVTLPDCNFIPGSNLYFVLLGDAACGVTSQLDVSVSPPLYITNATQPYTTKISLTTTYLSPCAENSTMTVDVHNFGAPSFGTTDSILIKIPPGVTFIPGSFVGIHNAPSNSTPVQYTNSGDTTFLIWRLPPGVAAGDSSVFTFNYKGNAHELSCSVVFFEAKAYSVSVLSCVNSSVTCIANITTGDTILPVFTYKAYLYLNNASSTSMPSPPNQEIVNLGFDITNTGQAILTEADSIIQFYYDANADSVYDAGDIFIAEDTVVIPKDSTIHYTKTLHVNAGQTCSIIAIIDPNRNPCVCNSAQIQLQPPLYSLGTDTTVCSGTTLPIGVGSINGYTYSWSPSIDLNDSTISDPQLTTSNNTSFPVSTSYILNTNRVSCSSNDTIIVTVNPIPISNAGNDIALCPGFTGQLGSASISGYNYQWTPSNGLSDSTISNPTVLLDVAGTYTYIVTSTSLNCSSTDTVVVTINPIPLSDAGSDVLTCASNTPQTIGASSTPGYSYQWTPSSGLSNDTIPNPEVNIVTADTLTYIVTTTALGCVSSDTIGIRINPLPTATISGSTQVCQNSGSPSILFTGSGGTPPYTFTYSLNNDSTQLSISTVSGDTVSIIIPTNLADTFSYTLISVQESSITACSQSQNSNATVIVNPLPTASITGTAQVCMNDSNPTITFTGSNGVPPYTFTYSINRGTTQSITTNNGNSIDLPVSTSVADTLEFILIDVTDSGATTCSQLQPDTALVMIHPLPTANFTFANVCLHENIYFNDSSQGNGATITAWLWSFGDSSSAFTSQNPIYLYQSSGNFNVVLTVATSNGCSDTISQTITVHPLPIAQFTTLPAAIGICDGTPVSFNDISTVGVPDIVQQWNWQFGDSSPADNNQNTSHLYDSASTYNVQLNVVSDFGCIDSIIKPITINANPVVNFVGNPVNGCEPLCVYFSDSSSLAHGNNAQWTWNIGDGSIISNSQIFEHCYTTDSISIPSSLNVSLTVTSDSGCVGTLIKTNFITVYPKSQAAFSIDPTQTTVINTLVSIIDSSLGATSWTWDFGDMTGSNDQNPGTHTYPTSDTGTYTITLITSTQYACNDTAYKSVIIEGDFAFYIPNAFTPDGDGINDFFFGKGIGIAKYQFWIFDRWGNLIFDCDVNDLPQSSACQWDGIVQPGGADMSGNSGKLAQRDVYVWKAVLVDIFGNEHRYIGTVTLVR